MGALTARPRRLIVAGAVVVLVLAAGLWWRAGAEDRDRRAVVDQLYALCLARAASSTGTDADVDRCDAERDALMQRLGL